MGIVFIILLGILEHILVMVICKELASIEYEEISHNYSSFKFNVKKIERYGINMLIRIFFPVIYIIIFAGILYKLNWDTYVNNIYWVTTVFYMCRWFVISIVLQRAKIHYWRRDIGCFIISFILSIGVYYAFITKTRNIFISLDALRDAIWFAILSFFVAISWNYFKNKFTEKDEVAAELRERYIYSYYKKFKMKYKVSIENKKIEDLVYAIMIYENYNRPILVRMIEYIKYFICGKATMGIMQIESEVLISDKESIRLGIKKIKRSYKENNGNISMVINDYNKGDKYYNEVIYINEKICEMRKAE